MSNLISKDMVGNTLHIGDEIIFHTMRYGGVFDRSTIIKIEKNIKDQYGKTYDKIYFKQMRGNYWYTMNQRNTDLIKVIKEK